MNATAFATRNKLVRLREARRQLLEAGNVEQGLIDPALQASWKRSLDYGLAPGGRTPGAPHASGAQLARALECRRAFVSQAVPIMEFLAQQIHDSDSIVIVADSQGMLLQSMGDPEFADKASRVALRPGAIWDEQWRGTNAIGTALAASKPVVVHGPEHYLERNAFLTCAAAPITDPAGKLLGVLDISGDQRRFHRHTLALVRLATRTIEHQLFQARFAAALQLRLHTHIEGIGTVTEGLLAVNEDGWIIGANATGLAMVGFGPTDIGAARIDAALLLELQSQLGNCNKTGRLPRAVQRADGSTLWVRVDPGRTVLRSHSGGVVTPCTRAAPADALAALDTGDGAMLAVICRARRVIDKPIALLLQGESGVGKELFARACHGSGPRHAAPFVAVNCAALPETLIEAELFGYRPGAYTGAAREGAPGRIREANGGTLFLDEIGDMPLAMQARLLRVLQERQVLPLGGGKPVAVDFRLICATHRRLRAEVESGRFREDLYYRINGLALQLPPLRERGDLGALVATILSEVASGREMRLSPAVAAAFARYRWPGNVRQLTNVLRTACALVGDDDEVIDWSHLPDDMAEELNGAPKSRIVEDGDIDLRLQADRCIQRAVQASNGNLSEAARRLGISRNTLYRKLRQLEASS
jgi:sigma-54 dependent transcriptional regulator, acetoin dehydrogenase operon transcriptional activator AcoR